MAAIKKILLIGRHGKAPQKPEGGSEDRLVPETVTDLYERVGVPMQLDVVNEGYEPENTFLRHTNKVRTRLSGQAVLAGMFRMAGYGFPPQCQEDLADYQNLRLIDTAEEPGFNIGNPNLNLEVYKAHGADACLDFGLANPTAAEHEGVPVEPYERLAARTREGIRNCVGNLLGKGSKDLGVLVSHASVTEPGVIALINSGRSTPVEKMADIGGGFKMAEFAELTLQKTIGGVLVATLNYKGQDYKVDLQNI